MDQEPRQGSEAVGEQREPEQIRREIEQTRGDLGETVERLVEKTDVKARAREKVEEVKAKVGEATPSSAGDAAGVARSNPLPFAVAGALVVGFLIGRITSR